MKTGPWALPDAGYYGWRGEEGHYLICDAGDFGPDYNPAHWHGDALSFELSLRGHRVIVDTGVFDYERSEMRQYCRSTKAHNTVEVNGESQCEFWAAFRVARRGRVKGVNWKPSEEGFGLKATFIGYRRRWGKPVHTREWEWTAAGRLRITDWITNRKPVPAIGRLHLHPECRVERHEERTFMVAYPQGKFLVSVDEASEPYLENSWYCPELGKKIPNKAICCRQEGTQLRFEVTIEEISNH